MHVGCGVWLISLAVDPTEARARGCVSRGCWAVAGRAVRPGLLEAGGMCWCQHLSRSHLCMGRGVSQVDGNDPSLPRK